MDFKKINHTNENKLVLFITFVPVKIIVMNRLLSFIISVSLSIVFMIKCKNIKTFKEKLPEQFGYYQSIDSSKIIRAGNIQMTLLLESTEEIQSFLTADNQVILKTVPRKDENYFYKISPGGELVESLQLNSPLKDLIFVKGFIIDKKKNQYYKWSFNGNNQPIDMSMQNERLDSDVKKQEQQLASITKNAPFVYIDYRFDSPAPQKPSGNGIQPVQNVKKYAVLTYFLNDQCIQFFTGLDVFDHFSYVYMEKVMLNNLFKRINTEIRAKDDKEIINSPNLKYRYFQNLKLEEVQFSGGGGGASGYKKMIYHGNLYTDVIFKDDTLKLKEFMYLDKEALPSAIEIDGKTLGMFTKNKEQPPAVITAYMYYTKPELEYALFSNDDKKIYIIKKR